MIDYKRMQKAMVLQKNISNGGVACLQSILRYYGLSYSLEQLKNWSDTSHDGTTLLGLIKGAQESGLEADGYEADMQSLQNCEDICILHVVMYQRFDYFLIYWGYNNTRKKYIIGNPAKGVIEEYSELALDMIWESRFLILIKSSIGYESHKATSAHYTWNWIFKFVKSNRNWLITALILSILVALLSLSTIVFTKKLIEQIIPSTDYFQLFSSILILAVFLVFRSVFEYIRKLLLLHQAKDLNVKVIEDFATVFLSLPKSFFDNQRIGDILAKMNNVLRIQYIISEVTTIIVVDLFLIVAIITITFFYQWYTAVLMIIWLLLFGWIVRKFHNPNLAGQQSKMNTYIQVENMFIDTIQGIGTIKAFNRQNLFLNLTKRFFESYQAASLFSGKISIRFVFWTDILGIIFLCGVLLSASLPALQLSVSIGMVLVLLQMAIMLMDAASRLSMVSTQLQEARIYFNHMQEFITLLPEYDSESDKKMAKIESFEKIQVDNLNFSFVGQKSLLDQITLTVCKGELVVVIGATNTGKTTFSQIIQKFYKFDNGEIKINGLNIDMVSTESWRNCLGVVDQEVNILNGTIVDNIIFGDQLDDPDLLIKFLRNYGFDTYFRQFPQEINTFVGKGGITLSGSQRQLVGLARSLWKKPQLLVLDEILPSLDHQTERFVLNLLTTLKSKMGILLLTHREDTVIDADKIYKWF